MTKDKNNEEPFFARFLEGQFPEVESDIHSGDRPGNIGAQPSRASQMMTTMKYPSDDDEYITLKYPSDNDEG